ncbi:MAG TPA: LysR family transcriptional regulator [Novosphingobium sp.]|nr:LysR family transcriptional regulator [Novosphingobium sp.]
MSGPRLLGRAAAYFEEVARCGSIRRAAESLHISASAIDRQIIDLEADLGVALFERSPRGLRLTAAGEILLGAVRRWRRDLARSLTQIDDLRGLRRGEVTIGLVEGCIDFLAGGIGSFRAAYPGIAYRLLVAGGPRVCEMVAAQEVDFALVFNPPPANHALHVEKTLIYQIGAVVRADDPLAARAEIAFAEIAAHPLILPDDSLSLSPVVQQAAARLIGSPLRGCAVANSVAGMKALVRAGVGVGVMYAVDACEEIASGAFRFLPFSEPNLPVSALSVITASGRSLAMPARLMVGHFAGVMAGAGVPVV